MNGFTRRAIEMTAGDVARPGAEPHRAGILSGDDGRLVVLNGRLDSWTAGEVRARLHAAVDAGTGPLLVDLAGVWSIDVTGLGVLVGTQRRAKHRDRRLELRGTPDRFARLLRVTGLERVLPPADGRPAGTGERAPRALREPRAVRPAPASAA